MQEKGMTLVNAVVADDGRLVVTVEWPDGQFRVLDRDEAVLLSLTLLQSAGRLFPTLSAFSETITAARGKIEPMQPCTRQ
jgi:hypothetical protein